MSQATKDKIGAKNKGRKPSQLAKDRSHASCKGRTHTAEAKAKLSAALILNHQNNPRRMTRETRDKMSATHKALGTGEVLNQVRREQLALKRMEALTKIS